MIKSMGIALALTSLFVSCKSAQRGSSLESATSASGNFQGTKNVDVDLSSGQGGDNFKLEISYQVSPNIEPLIPELTGQWKYEGLLASMCQSELQVQKELVRDAVNENKTAKIVLHITLPVSFEANDPKNKAGDWLDKVGRCQRTFRNLDFTLRDSSSRSDSMTSFFSLAVLRKGDSAVSVNNVTKPTDGIYQVAIKDIAKFPSQTPTVQLPDSAFKAGVTTKIHISEK